MAVPLGSTMQLHNFSRIGLNDFQWHIMITPLLFHALKPCNLRTWDLRLSWDHINTGCCFQYALFSSLSSVCCLTILSSVLLNWDNHDFEGNATCINNRWRGFELHRIMSTILLLKKVYTARIIATMMHSLFESAVRTFPLHCYDS